MGPILSRLLTKVHEIFGLSMSRFIQKIFVTKSGSHRKTEQF